MARSFSANNPIIEFRDLTTESGRNIQLGYMKIFEGAMIGIRKPMQTYILMKKKQFISFFFLVLCF